MKSKALSIGALAAIMLADLSFSKRVPAIGRSQPAKKDFKKHLSEYRVPPRSITQEEKEYYDKHKTLDGFYK